LQNIITETDIYFAILRKMKNSVIIKAMYFAEKAKMQSINMKIYIRKIS